MEAERATGLVLQQSLVMDAASRQAMLQRPGCESDSTCLIEIRRASVRAALPGADALARQAAATRDPLLYASALNACALAEAQETSSACATLTPEQWAQLDPDNVIPWLLSAHEATRRRDVAAADSAMQRAARARRVDWRLAPVLSLPPRLPHLQEPVRAVVTSTLLVAYVGTLQMASASTPAPGLCTKATVAETARRVACSDVAELLVAKGATLMDHTVGAGLGSRVGWQAGRLQALNEERERLMEAFQVTSPPYGLGCDWMAATQRRMSEIAREGELGLARRVAAARDETRR